MDAKPIPLSNFDSKCYLNTCIQAISACTCFVKKIQNLYSENTGLPNLSLLNELMKLMNGNTGRHDISKNQIFNGWNKAGQQDSYELLSYVINHVYGEIRADKEKKGDIDKGDLDQWLETRLPLRINMENEIRCKCGYFDKSPLQTDIALHLSFPNTNKDYFYLNQLLENYFHKERIFDFVCEQKRCQVKDASKTLKLFSPSPDTICIHLQRLRLNGRHMTKINSRVYFCNRLTIKGIYLKETYPDEEAEDVHYYLKSVIVHYGGDSSGHYACYRKSTHSWYYVDNTKVRDASADDVFCCNPYILFYEKSESEEISPTIIKMDKNLNIFIHAIVSCFSFVDWLNRIAVHNKILSTTLLAYLVDLVNGNVIKDEQLEREVKYDWCGKKTIYETMMDVFDGVHHKGNELEDKWFKENVPFGNLVINTCKCKCGLSAPSPPQLNRTIDLMCNSSNKNLQALFDMSFDGTLVNGHVCDNKNCSANEGHHTQRLCRPLSKTICIRLLNNIVLTDLSEELIITKKHCVNGGENDLCSKKNNDAIYQLKSIVLKGGCICYRKINNDWYSVDDIRVKMIQLTELLSCTPFLMFFQLMECEDSIQKNDNSSIEAVSSDYSDYVSEDIPESVPDLGLKDPLASIVHCLTSCTKFNEWMDVAKTKGNLIKAMSLFRLINLSNSIDMEEGTIDTNIIEKWNDFALKDIYGLMNTIQQDLMKEIGGAQIVKPLVIFNMVIDNAPSSQSSMIIDFQLSTVLDKTKVPLQKILHESIELYANTESIITMLMNKVSPNSVLFKGDLPNTICFHFPHYYHSILASTELIIRNQLCAQYHNSQNPMDKEDCNSYDKCCKKYELKSVIDINGRCYTCYHNQWYKMIGCNSSFIDESYLVNLEILMLFYETNVLNYSIINGAK